MATLAAPDGRMTAERKERRFFLIMAIAMCATIIAGFSLNIAAGRSSFSSPWPVHAHGVVFMGWLALYLAQAYTIATDRRALHIRLGKFAYIWIPLMVVLGLMIMIRSAILFGGPFFFSTNEFLIGNSVDLLVFAGLALWSIRIGRHRGWHRRLMLVAMTVLTGPGLGRLLPAPLLIPHAWTMIFVATLIFPAIGMIADRRTNGHVHPAYWWGSAIYVGAFLLALGFANSAPGIALTEWVVAGSPGADRPMEAHLPPGFRG